MKHYEQLLFVASFVVSRQSLIDVLAPPVEPISSWVTLFVVVVCVDKSAPPTYCTWHTIKCRLIVSSFSNAHEGVANRI